MKNSKVAIAIILATSINIPAFADELPIVNTYSQVDRTVEEGNILGNPSQFVIRDEKGERFILSSDEWIQIQLFATTAKGLPITEEAMRNQFQMTDDIVMEGVYTDLLTSYSSIYNIAGQWLDPQGYRDQMIELAGELYSYSGQVVTRSESLETLVNNLVDAATSDDQEKFNKYKAVIKILLDKMRGQTVVFQEKGKQLGDKLTTFINTLDQETSHLDKVEEHNAAILTNDGSKVQEKIDRLIVEKDALNDEYAKWATVAGTSPTYAWIFPWGTLAAIGTASAGTAEAIALKARLDEKAQELEDAKAELIQTVAIYQSWKLAKTNLGNIRTEMVKANQSLGKLRGGWQNIIAQLDGIISSIDGITTETVLENPDMFIAAFLSQVEVDVLQDKWRKLEELSEKWIENAYVNPTSKVIFGLNSRMDAAHLE